MTKKGLLSGASKEERKDGVVDPRRTPQEANPNLNKQTLQTRIPSAKKLPPVDEATTAQNTVVGKFSESAASMSSETEDASALPPLPAIPTTKQRSALTRAESSGQLRRGTPRPQELKKTLSTVKFVLQESGLDQVEEEDLEMV